MIRNDANNLAHKVGHMVGQAHNPSFRSVLKVTATLAEINFEGYFGVERNEVKC